MFSKNYSVAKRPIGSNLPFIVIEDLKPMTLPDAQFAAKVYLAAQECEAVAINLESI